MTPQDCLEYLEMKIRAFLTEMRSNPIRPYGAAWEKPKSLMRVARRRLRSQLKLRSAIKRTLKKMAG